MVVERWSVYQEWESRLIPARGHGNGVHYRVFFGTVNWDGEPDSISRAFVIFMQYGGERTWHEAVRLKQIAWCKPVHVIEEELDAVLQAINELRQQHENRR